MACWYAERGHMSGTTVWCSLDNIYYDGLMTIEMGCYSGQGPVHWLGRELPEVQPNRNANASRETPEDALSRKGKGSYSDGLS
jgi:hypothetical protein